MLTVAALACINDRDTLAEEAKVRPELFWTIVGRFNRFPAKYYQMRIDRVKKELAANPRQPDLYDDIAAAYDRIHDDDRAIIWINRKKKILDQMNRSETSNPMDWYRIYANEGTFIAHRALGEKTKNLKEVARGRDKIAKALALNPEAHFGREGTQLAVLNWMIDHPKEDISLGDYLPQNTKDGFGNVLTNEQIVDALAGLVRLGAAWESPVAFGAISDLTFDYDSNNLSGMAAARVKELLKGDESQLYDLAGMGAEALHETSDAAFRKYRAEADTWHQHRVEFMESRFSKGMHPDTDSNFWDGFREDPLPELPPAAAEPSFLLRIANGGIRAWVTWIAVFAAGFLVVVAGWLTWSRLRNFRVDY